MAVNVLIAGAGQLGSRYLQGLSRFPKPAKVWVFDVSADSLKRARQRWQECDQQPHTVNYVQELGEIPTELDMVFVTTNSDVRLEVVSKIAKIFSVRYWVLEKILAQSIQQLQDLQVLTASCEGAWVNTPMYLWPLYSELRQKSDTNLPIEAHFTGYKGLACNAIHYIDFVARWSGSNVIGIDTAGLNNSWVSSKRQGFMEVEGSMSIAFSDGSQLILSGSEHANDYRVRINTSSDRWLVDESSGIAKSASGEKITAPILMQSELTGPLLHDILANGKCDLPSLKVSIEQHEAFIDALLEHWNRYMPTRLDYVPIT